MQEQIINAIIAYTDHLRIKQKLQVSFCNISGYFDSYMHILYPYNYHRNVFCESVKASPEAMSVCVAKQKRVMEKCKDGVFFGSCWAGMEEYVFPIRHGNTVLGFVSVSGYRKNTDLAMRKIKSLSEKYGLNEKTLVRDYLLGTQESLPSDEEIKTLVDPLCIMLERLYMEYLSHENDAKTPPEKMTLYQKILDFVCNNYSLDLSIEGIAKRFNYSASYVGKLFYKNSKRHLTEYVSELRLKRSLELLTDSVLSVSEIASAVGFKDANYFSTAFKKRYGKSPNKYRKQ